MNESIGLGEARDIEMNTHDILLNYGGELSNNLHHLINSNEDIHLDLFNLKRSLYYDIGTIEHFLNKHKDRFCVMSLNIQSLHAKFDQFNSIITNLKLKDLYFDCICLQETWLSHNDNYSSYQMEGYTLVKKDLEENCSKHGGLLIYVKNHYEISKIEILSNKIAYEGIAINLKMNNKQLTILNLYRPPCNANRLFEDFIHDFIPYISNHVSKNGELIVAGDFNINLLKIINDNSASSFFDHMINLHLLPNITFPSRFNNNSCSLIDQIFTKFTPSSQQSCSGILFSDLSDHCPIFTALDCQKTIYPKKSKFITIKYRPNNFNDLLKKDIEAINFDSLFDNNNNANDNYNIFIDTLTRIISKYNLSKTVRLNKYKHKLNGWISFGILNSIKNREKFIRNSVKPLLILLNMRRTPLN